MLGILFVSNVADACTGDMSVMCYEEVCSLVLDLVCRLCPTRAEVALHAIQRLTTLCSQHPMLLMLFVKQVHFAPEILCDMLCKV